MVLTTALILSRLQRDDGADPKAIKYILLLTGFIELFIFTENLSTAAGFIARRLCHYYSAHTLSRGPLALIYLTG